jgi:hypothetical protein
MGIDRLGTKRTKRTRTWASVCVGLFCDGEGTDGSAEGTRDGTLDATE